MAGSGDPEEHASGGTAPRPRVIAHVDMDAFFASVEQRDDPALRGLPVIVGADPASGRGVVAASSYEARRFGVKSAMPITHAYRLCPHGIYVRPRHSRYAEVSSQVFAEFVEADVIEEASIDEAYLDLSSRFTRPSEAREWAEDLKTRIAGEHGITCTIGLGPNKLVAKIASDREKPDGLTIIDARADAFLAPLPARVIPGVGPKTAARLEELGVRTCEDLAGLDARTLKGEFGSFGPRLAELARGIDDTPVIGEWTRKSSGSETTFLRDTADPGVIHAALDACARDAWEGLRNDGLFARTVTVKVRYADYTTFTRAKSLPVATDDEETLRDSARRIFAELELAQPLRLLGVRFSGLTTATSRQESLRRWPADVYGEADTAWVPSASAVVQRASPRARRLDEYAREAGPDARES